MTPSIFCLKAFDEAGQEQWSFCWMEGSPTGCMLQGADSWLNFDYPFNLVCSLVWGWTVRYPHYRLTFSVVVPSTTAPLAAD